MAYQTGVSSSVSDLISALFLFAKSNGFTEGSSWVQSNYNVRSMVKNGIHYVFKWDADELYINTATSVAGSGDLTSQPGAHSNNARVSPIIGPHVGYHFFGDGSRIHVAVELVVNAFNHFSFGEIEKAGNWVGGTYVSNNYQVTSNRNSFYYGSHCRIFDYLGSSENGHIRATFGGSTTHSITSSGAKFTSWDLMQDLLNVSPNDFNMRAALLVPELLLSSQPGSSSPAHWMQLGHIPNAAVLNIANLNPKEMVNNDWMVFPVYQKNGPATSYVNSGNYGVAFRK